MGTKNNPGKFDCYTKAYPDEPMFILLGRDPFAPLLVRLWSELRHLAGDDIEKIHEALNCEADMRAWLAELERKEAIISINFDPSMIKNIDELKNKLIDNQPYEYGDEK